jgi:heme/copper-type cytochrome/quinol oxidase subunit 3
MGPLLFDDRAETARLGIRLGLISLAMLFLGLIGAFIVQRAATAEWPPAGVRLNLPLGAINTAVILGSSAALAAALRSSRRAQAEGARLGILLGGGLALLFLGIQALQYYWLVTNFGQTLRSSPFGTYFYCLTGLHGLHLLVGVVWLCFLMMGRRQRPLSIEICGTYWHFVTLIWAVLFVIFYLI